MNKFLYILILLTVNLNAISFEALKEAVLKQNEDLKALEINIEQTKQKVQKMTRYENPQLGVNLSRFKNENGFSVDLSQKILLPSVKKRLEKLADLEIEKSIFEYTLTRANIVKSLSLRYADYLQKTALVNLAYEETRIAKKIYEISKARFSAGTIAKSGFLQAKLSYLQSRENEKKLLLEKERFYYDLLLDFKISEEIHMQPDHRFSSENSDNKNPEISLYEINEKIAKMRKKIDTKPINSLSLSGGYEKEPDQDIYRIGISMPVAVLNHKRQERKIARLQIRKEKLSLQMLKKRVAIHLKKLQKEKVALTDLKNNTIYLLNEEKKILEIFQQGYKIANINLLELQDLKNRLIETKKRLIMIETDLNKNSILKNYLTGVYND